MCFGAAGSIIASLCVAFLFFLRVCVLVGEHLASKRLSEQSDELGVCGHAFNELRTRPELKEKGGGGGVRREGGRKRWRWRRITLWNTCFGLAISVPGRGQSTLSAVTFPFTTSCSSEEIL